MSIEILKDAVITVELNPVTAGTTAQTSAAATDIQGFEACAFLASFGTVTDTSVVTLTVYGVATNTTSGGVSLGSATFTASTNSNTTLLVDVVRPAYRYLYGTITRTVANAVINNLISVKYRASNSPVTQPAAMLASSLVAPGV